MPVISEYAYSLKAKKKKSDVYNMVILLVTEKMPTDVRCGYRHGEREKQGEREGYSWNGDEGRERVKY